jgi:hypothetical protein
MHQDYALLLLPSATVNDVRQQLQQQHGLAPWAGMKVSFACCSGDSSVTHLQFVYCGSVLGDEQSLQSMGYAPGKSLVVTAPPASSGSASAPPSAASINAAIDAAYDASLAADAARISQ